MNNFLKNALFVLPIIALIAVPVAIHKIKDRSKTDSASLVSDMKSYNNSNSAHHEHAGSAMSRKTENYSMPEPFSPKLPGSDCCGVMSNPMNISAWMQMMNSMINSMQMTQMMHQMAAMPMQMMNPAMWMKPHGLIPNNAVSTVQQPMSPEEYKKWYEQQQKTLKQDDD